MILNLGSRELNRDSGSPPVTQCLTSSPTLSQVSTPGPLHLMLPLLESSGPDPSHHQCSSSAPRVPAFPRDPPHQMLCFFDSWFIIHLGPGKLGACEDRVWPSSSLHHQLCSHLTQAANPTDSQSTGSAPVDSTNHRAKDRECGSSVRVLA